LIDGRRDSASQTPELAASLARNFSEFSDGIWASTHRLSEKRDDVWNFDHPYTWSLIRRFHGSTTLDLLTTPSISGSTGVCYPGLRRTLFPSNSKGRPTNLVDKG